MLLLAEEKSGLFKDYQFVLYRQPLPLTTIILRDIGKGLPDDTTFELVDVEVRTRLWRRWAAVPRFGDVAGAAATWGYAGTGPIGP